MFMPGKSAAQKYCRASEVLYCKIKNYSYMTFIKMLLILVGNVCRKTSILHDKEFCSGIVIMEPESDLCSHWQNFLTSHSKLSGCSEKEKQNFLPRAFSIDSHRKSSIKECN